MKKVYCYVIIVLLAFIGCVNKDELAGGDLINGNHTLKAQIEQSANTRTMVDEENRVCWVKGDQIGVFGGEGVINIPFSFSGMADSGQSAIFKGNLPEGGAPSVAYYPYDDEAVLEGDKLSFVLPSEYDYTENSNAPMIGVKQDNGSFLFKHLCGLLRLSVVGIPEGTTTLKIKSEGPDAPAIAGNAVVHDIHQFGAVLAISTDQATEITISCESESVSNKVFLIPLPVATYPHFSISMQSEDRIFFEKHISDCSIKRATILDMPEVSLLPDAEFAVDKTNGEMVLFDYKNNAIVSYMLKENGLPEAIRVWNVEDDQAEGNWSEIVFYEDGTIKSIMYDINHIMVFNNYRKDQVDMAYYVNGNITVYKGVLCDDMDWDIYKKNIANGIVITKGFVDDLDRFVNGLKKFATEYAEEIALASSSLTCATSALAASSGAGIPLAVYNCGGAIKDWAIYLGKKFDSEHAEEWELLEDLDDCYSIFKLKKLAFISLKDLDSYIDFAKNGYEYYNRAGEAIASSVQLALEQLQKSEEISEIHVETSIAADITSVSAVCYAKLTGDLSKVVECGFIYFDPIAVMDRYVKYEGQIDNQISVILTDLMPNTIYNYRAVCYTSDSNEPIIGESLSFTTKVEGIIGTWECKFTTSQGDWWNNSGILYLDVYVDGKCIISDGSESLWGTWNINKSQVCITITTPADEEYPFEVIFTFIGTLSEDCMNMGLKHSGYVMCKHNNVDGTYEWVKESIIITMDCKRLITSKTFYKTLMIKTNSQIDAMNKLFLKKFLPS